MLLTQTKAYLTDLDWELKSHGFHDHCTMIMKEGMRYDNRTDRNRLS